MNNTTKKWASSECLVLKSAESVLQDQAVNFPQFHQYFSIFLQEHDMENSKK